MAVANTKSTSVTNADNTGTASHAFSAALRTGYEPRTAMETAAVLAADDDTSVYRFFRVRSDAIITSIEVYNDAITSGTDYDFGVYQTAGNGGAVVDADLFADGVDMSSARVTPLQVRFNDTATAKIEEFTKPLWQLLGLSADPKRDYDLCWTANTVGSAAGDITTKIEMYLPGA